MIPPADWNADLTLLRMHANQTKGRAMQNQELQNGAWPDNMRPPEAAHYLRVSVSKLAKLRMRRNRDGGPRYVKLTGVVIYRRDDLDAWLSTHTVGGIDV